MLKICCILIWQIFQLILLSSLFPVSFCVCTKLYIEIPILLLSTLHITTNIAHHITEVLIFNADKLMVIGSFKNFSVFNFAILLISRKSRKFDACKIYMFYSSNSLLALCPSNCFWKFDHIYSFGAVGNNENWLNFEVKRSKVEVTARPYMVK